MNFKEEYKKLIKKIRSSKKSDGSKWTVEEIAARIGYKRISIYRFIDEKTEVSQNDVLILKIWFHEVLQIDTLEIYENDHVSEMGIVGKLNTFESRQETPALPPGFKELMDAITEGFNSSALVKTLEEVREALRGSSLASTKAKDIETFGLNDHKKGRNASERK